VLSRWVRKWVGALLNPFLVVLARCGIGPDAVTMGSLAVVLLSGTLIALGYTVSGGLVLLLGGILDGLDGALARQQQSASPFGAFLDSIADHCGDFAVYFGLLCLLLHDGGRRTETLLLFAALFGSLFGSQIRSRAGMLGMDLKDVGFFTRFERVLVLVLGLMSGRITESLWVLALGTNLSALQRLHHALRAWRSLQSGRTPLT